MKFLLKISMPHEPFNSYVRNGKAGATMGRIMGETKPEAAYFAEMNGRRTGILIINVTDVSQIPHYAEPWFLLFQADVEFHPVMSAEDLGKANLEELGKKWSS
jgi:hypothetical protein